MMKDLKGEPMTAKSESPKVIHIESARYENELFAYILDGKLHCIYRVSDHMENEDDREFYHNVQDYFIVSDVELDGEQLDAELAKYEREVERDEADAEEAQVLAVAEAVGVSPEDSPRIKKIAAIIDNAKQRYIDYHLPYRLDDLSYRRLGREANIEALEELWFDSVFAEEKFDEIVAQVRAEVV